MWTSKSSNGLVKKRFRDIEISSLSDYDALNTLKMSDMKTALVTGAREV